MMPKDRRSRSMSFEQCSHHHGRQTSPSASANPPIELSGAAVDNTKEWEEARCPVCMEHPHNAVLLLCSFQDKGCRPYMCDTSYRHSNCLDQFRKASLESTSIQGSLQDQLQSSKLTCPLCRGLVRGWTVVQAARKYMDTKVRNCSTESCEYSGTYRELRKHARMEHPSMRPSVVDPERQRDWRRMEQQRDIGDVFSSIQSALGVEERGVGISENDDDLPPLSIFSPSSTFTVYLIYRVLEAGSGNGFGAFPSMTSGVPSRLRTGTRSRRRDWTLWGESYDGELGSTGRRRSHSHDAYIVDEDDTHWPNDVDLISSSQRSRSHGYIVEDDDTELLDNVEPVSSVSSSTQRRRRRTSQHSPGRARRRRRMWTSDGDDLV